MKSRKKCFRIVQRRSHCFSFQPLFSASLTVFRRELDLLNDPAIRQQISNQCWIAISFQIHRIIHQLIIIADFLMFFEQISEYCKSQAFLPVFDFYKHLRGYQRRWKQRMSSFELVFIRVRYASYSDLVHPHYYTSEAQLRLCPPLKNHFHQILTPPNLTQWPPPCKNMIMRFF